MEKSRQFGFGWSSISPQQVKRGQAANGARLLSNIFHSSQK
jgi:hypothetical protein